MYFFNRYTIFVLAGLVFVTQVVASIWRFNNPQIEPRFSGYLKSARHHMDIARYGYAEQRYDYALSIYPHDSDAIHGSLIAQTLDAVKNKGSKDSELFKILQDNKIDIDVRTYFALENIRNGKLDSAENILSQVVNQRANMSRAWYGLGMISAKNKDHDSALLHFDRAIDLHPRVIDYISAKAQSLTAVGSLEEAAEIYGQAIELDDRRIINLTGKAYNLSKQGNKTKLDETIEISLQKLGDDVLMARKRNSQEWCFTFLSKCLNNTEEKINFLNSLR